MKLGSKPRSHMVDFLFVLALFCVFAASALLVVLIGANVYKGTVRQMDLSYTGRTSLAYISTKVRQNDVRDGVHVLPTADGDNALVLRQDLDGQIFETWIYHHDGALREVFVPMGTEFDLEIGHPVLDVQSFAVEAHGDLLTVTVQDTEGNRYCRRIAVRCG